MSVKQTKAGKKSDRATMEKIAERVGVTKMTVSRALRGVGRISEHMRREIRRVAGEMGYLTLNQGVLAAPSHRGCSDLRLALLVVESALPHASSRSELSRELLRGMEDRLALSQGRVISLALKSKAEILRAWDEQKAHGVVLRTALPPSWVTELRRRGPVVYATSNDVYPGVDSVYCAEMRTAALLADYLSRRGHHRIAWFGFFDIHKRDTPIRDTNGFSRFGSIHGPRYAAWNYVAQFYPSDEQHTFLMLERDWQSDSLTDVIRRGFDSLLSAHPRPTAIILPSDVAGAELLRCATAAGLNVPRDLSLIAYGGTSDASVGDRRLTCVKLPHYIIGRTVPELIERRLADPRATPVTVQFEAHIDAGDTVAPRPRMKRKEALPDCGEERGERGNRRERTDRKNNGHRLRRSDKVRV